MTRRLMLCMGVLLLGSSACKESTVQGPADKKLTIVKPSDTSVTRGDTAKVALTVKREHFSDPVTIEFSRLPKGVSIVDDGSKVEGSERTFVMKAADDADLVSNHVATVSARGPDGMTTTVEFEITVKDRKS